MIFPVDQAEALKKLYINVQIAEEGGSTIFFQPNLKLPEGLWTSKICEAINPSTEPSADPDLLFHINPYS